MTEIASGRSKFRYNRPDNAAAAKTIRKGPQETAIKKGNCQETPYNSVLTLVFKECPFMRGDLRSLFSHRFLVSSRAPHVVLRAFVE